MLTAAAILIAAGFIAGACLIQKKEPAGEGGAVSLKRILSGCALVLILSLAAEIFVGNAGFFKLSKLEPVQIYGGFAISPQDNTVEMTDINLKTDTLYIDCEKNQTPHEFTARIYYTDGSISVYDWPLSDRKICTSSDESQLIKLNLAGKTGSLKIQFDTADTITVNGIYVNKPINFDFSIKRFAMFFAALTFIYLLRPKSALYEMTLKENKRYAFILAALFTAAITAVCALVIFTTALDADSLPAHHSQYAKLAESFTEGKLSVDYEMPEWLPKMADPYDTPGRWKEFYDSGSGPNFMYDVAYYDGNYYVYFGVLPVILFYLPYYLITGAAFKCEWGIFIAFFFFTCGVFSLIKNLALKFFPKTKLAVYLTLCLAFLASSQLFVMTAASSFYSLPVICAVSLAVWGLSFWIRSLMSEKHTVLLCVFGSLFMALIAACRPNVVLISAVAIPLFYGKYIKEGFIKQKQGLKEFICLIAPYIAVAGLLMYYNAARFSSPINFGEKYNLAMINLTARTFREGIVYIALGGLLFASPNINFVFPYVHTAAMNSLYMGEVLLTAAYGGLFTTSPILWPTLFSGGTFKRLKEKKLLAVWVILAALAIVLCIFSVEFSGVVQRYIGDFSFMLLTAGAITALCFEEAAEERASSALYRKVLFALADLSVVFGVLCALSSYCDVLYTQNITRYYNLFYTFAFWL